MRMVGSELLDFLLGGPVVDDMDDIIFSVRSVCLGGEIPRIPQTSKTQRVIQMYQI